MRSQVVQPVKADLVPLADRLRLVAETIGTQAEAARQAGVSLRQMQKYIAARAEPATEALARLAVCSGFRLEWLLSGDGSPREGEPLAPGATAPLDRVYSALASSPSAVSKMYPGNPDKGAAALRAGAETAELTLAALTHAHEMGGPKQALRIAQLLNRATNVTREIERTGLRFHKAEHFSAFKDSVYQLLVRLTNSIPEDDAWRRALQVVIEEGLPAAICEVSDLMRGRSPDEDWLPEGGLPTPADVALWLEVREVVWGHLKFVDRHNLGPGAKTK